MFLTGDCAFVVGGRVEVRGWEDVGGVARIISARGLPNWLDGTDTRRFEYILG